MAIDKIEIKSVSESDYFSDSERIGSTEYASYMEGAGTYASYLLKKRYGLDPEYSHALTFGSVLHDILAGEKKLKDYKQSDKLRTTTEASLAKGELGSVDYGLIEIFLNQFPIDLESIRKDSDLMEIEYGRWIDIESEGRGIKTRFKPDLFFVRMFDDEAVYVDFKTDSGNFYGSEMKYAAQGELYAFCINLAHGYRRIRHINYIFRKDYPYKQYTKTNIIEIDDAFMERVCKNLIEITIIPSTIEKVLKLNVDVSDEILRGYVKKE